MLLINHLAKSKVVACLWGFPYSHTDTQTRRHTDTHTDIQTCRHKDTQTHRHTDTQPWSQTQPQTHKHNTYRMYIKIPV